MKYNYFWKATFFFALYFSINITSAQSVVITTIVDGTVAPNACTGGSGSDPRFVELYVNGTIDFNDYDLDVSSNGGNWVSKDISSLGTISNQFVYLVQNDDLDAFDASFPSVTRIGISLGTINGNDAIRVENSSGTVLDIFGDPSEISSSSTFTGWNYQDSYVKRKDGVLPNNGVFNENDFIYPGEDALVGLDCKGLATKINLNSYSNVVWTGGGGINNDWDETTNWNTNMIPTGTDRVVIPNGLTNYPTISSPITINTITIESGASLIANSTVSANVTYNRNLSTDNWYLVSSPVDNQTLDNLISDNNFATGSGANIGIGTYNNNGTPAWNYETAASSGNIANGAGLSVKLNSAGTISFTGNINAASINKSITTGSRNNYNLIGNPYTSFVNLGTFLSDNNSVLSEQTVWVWNQATDSYDVKMAGIDDSFQIAPGQGFFVSAASSNIATFSSSNQSHQSDTFQRDAKTFINLTVSNTELSKNTKVYFIEGTTKGFDNGFDGSLFEGTNAKLSVYSYLASENIGKKYAVQSLPLKEIENISVPIGISTEKDEKITFSVNTSNLSNNYKVYLEDRTLNKYFDITNKEHTAISNNKNQYYLRTSSKDLSKTKPLATNINEVSIYKSTNNTINIVGLQATNASLKIYSLTGKQLVNKTFNSNGFSEISTSKLATGVYIIKLNSNLGNITKKVILE